MMNIKQLIEFEGTVRYMETENTLNMVLVRNVKPCQGHLIGYIRYPLDMESVIKSLCSAPYPTVFSYTPYRTENAIDVKVDFSKNGSVKPFGDTRYIELDDYISMDEAEIVMKELDNMIMSRV